MPRPRVSSEPLLPVEGTPNSPSGPVNIYTAFFREMFLFLGLASLSFFPPKKLVGGDCTLPFPSSLVPDGGGQDFTRF